LRLFFNLFDFFEVAFQIFTSPSSVDPFRRLLGDLLYDVKLDDFADISTVVGAFKDCELGMIFEF
jgi:hypothetical protein